MKILAAITTIAVFSDLLLAADGDNPPKAYDGGSKHVIDRTSPDLNKTGKWGKWKFWYIFRGTRSEGLHGELVIDGEKKIGTKVGEKFVTKGAIWTWYGVWDGRKQLFSKSGWLPQDLSTVYPSWNLKEEQGGADQPATASESTSEGEDNPKKQSEGRSQ